MSRLPKKDSMTPNHHAHRGCTCAVRVLGDSMQGSTGDSQGNLLSPAMWPRRIFKTPGARNYCARWTGVQKYRVELVPPLARDVKFTMAPSAWSRLPWMSMQRCRKAWLMKSSKNPFFIQGWGELLAHWCWDIWVDWFIQAQRAQKSGIFMKVWLEAGSDEDIGSGF